jgi:hypothetical protein
MAALVGMACDPLPMRSALPHISCKRTGMWSSWSILEAPCPYRKSRPLLRRFPITQSSVDRTASMLSSSATTTRCFRRRRLQQGCRAGHQGEPQRRWHLGRRRGSHPRPAGRGRRAISAPSRLRGAAQRRIGDDREHPTQGTLTDERWNFQLVHSKSHRNFAGNDRRSVRRRCRLSTTAGRAAAAGGVPIVNLIRWRARTNRAILSPDVGRLQSNLVAADRAVPIEGDT